MGQDCTHRTRVCCEQPCLRIKDDVKENRIEDNRNTCKEFLSEQNYVQRGAIPGLKIWVERNDKRFEGII